MAGSRQGKNIGSLHRRLFQNAMVAGAELYRMLDKIASLDEKSTEYTEAKKEYLDLISRLDALITNPGSEHLITNSLRLLAVENKVLQEAIKIPEYDKLTKEGQQYFVEFLQMHKLALNNDNRREWIAFALHCAENPKRMQKLSKLILLNFQNGVVSDWLNSLFVKKLSSFTEKIGKSKKPHVQKQLQSLIYNSVLDSLLKESKQSAAELITIQIQEKRAIVESWERRISEWSSPKQFEKLWKEYQKDILPLIDQLKVSKEMSPLSRKTVIKLVQNLTEMMDRTIKSMKGSPEYTDEDRKLQVERFVLLLEPYHKLMQHWMNELPPTLFDEWSKNIIDNRAANSKANMMQEIASTFDSLKTKLDARQLNPSNEFSVASAKVGSTASFARQFVQRKRNLTLEDMFTLMHQNILASTILLNNETQVSVKELPEEIRPIVEAMSQVQTANFKADLLSVSHDYPKLILEYNLPLRNHSSKITIEYDQREKKLVLDCNFFGHNMSNRMDNVGIMEEIESRFWKANFILPPIYKEDAYLLHYRQEVDTKTLPDIANHIKNSLIKAADITFAGSTLEAIYENILSSYTNIEKTEFLKNISKEDSIKHEKFIRFLINDLIKASTVDKLLLSQDEILKYVPDLLASGDSSSVDFSAESLTKLRELYHYPIDFNSRQSPEKYTIFELILLTSKLNANELQQFITKNNIDLKLQSYAMNAAFISGNMETIEALKKLGAECKQFNLNGLSAVFRNDNIFKIFDEMIKTHSETIPKLSKYLPDILLDRSIAERAVNNFLDRGVPFDAENPIILKNVFNYPSLAKRYLEHIKANFNNYNFAQLPALFSNIAYSNEATKFFLELGLPLQGLTTQDILLICRTKDPALLKVVVEYLLKNSKANKSPNFQDVSNELPNFLEFQGHDDLLMEILKQTDVQIKYNPYVFLRHNYNNKELGSALLNYLKQNFIKFTDEDKRALYYSATMSTNEIKTKVIDAIWPHFLSVLDVSEFFKFASDPLNSKLIKENFNQTAQDYLNAMISNEIENYKFANSAKNIDIKQWGEFLSVALNDFCRKANIDMKQRCWDDIMLLAKDEKNHTLCDIAAEALFKSDPKLESFTAYEFSKMFSSERIMNLFLDLPEIEINDDNVGKIFEYNHSLPLDVVVKLFEKNPDAFNKNAYSICSKLSEEVVNALSKHPNFKFKGSPPESQAIGNEDPLSDLSSQWFFVKMNLNLLKSMVEKGFSPKLIDTNDLLMLSLSNPKEIEEFLVLLDRRAWDFKINDSETRLLYNKMIEYLNDDKLTLFLLKKGLVIEDSNIKYDDYINFQRINKGQAPIKPLFLAIKEGDKSVVEFYISAGMKLTNANSYLPEFALVNNQLEIAKLLLNDKSYDGKSDKIWDWAIDKGDKELWSLLLQKSIPFPQSISLPKKENEEELSITNLYFGARARSKSKKQIILYCIDNKNHELANLIIRHPSYQFPNSLEELVELKNGILGSNDKELMEFLPKIEDTLDKLQKKPLTFSDAPPKDSEVPNIAEEPKVSPAVDSGKLNSPKQSPH